MNELEPMKVENPTIALELLAKDAAPLQSIRELTHNSIQAILATPERTGVIQWDVDWASVERSVARDEPPIYRLSCSDNGEGMTAEDQQKYINRLFVSGRSQGADKNFGIGAKVTAGARNPAGVEYRSWRDGSSSRIVFCRADDGSYGLERFERPDGKVECWTPVPYTAKPPQVGPHGTQVILYGTTGLEDTVMPPTDGGASGMKWLARYLNQRYFEFPEGIRVHARELPAERAKWPLARPAAEARAGSNRQVTGMRAWLDKNVASDFGSLATSGKTVLPDGTIAHWWILDGSGTSDVHWSRGHSAATFQSELYDVLDANANRVRLQQFGIFYSSRQVVLYLEPAVDVTATIARDSLRMNGGTLPWEAWGTAFRQDMPPSIRELERRIREAATEADHGKAIRERLKAYEDLFKITAWRAALDGTDKAWGDSPSGAKPSSDGVRNGSARGPSTGTLPSGGGTSKRDYLAAFDEEGVPADRFNPSRDIPTVQWVGFRETDRPQDRAAEYVRTENQVFANTEFRVFTDMTERLNAVYGSAHEDAGETINDTVREWYEQLLIEAVLRSWNFEHEVHWQDADYEKLTSPEALTMAVLPFTFMDARLRQMIATKIGRSSPG